MSSPARHDGVSHRRNPFGPSTREGVPILGSCTQTGHAESAGYTQMLRRAAPLPMTAFPDTGGDHGYRTVQKSNHHGPDRLEWCLAPFCAVIT